MVNMSFSGSDSGQSWKVEPPGINIFGVMSVATIGFWWLNDAQWIP